ncbi:hypothetical protein ACFQ07_07505, partial [Actinomadura adrarensis]
MARNDHDGRSLEERLASLDAMNEAMKSDDSGPSTSDSDATMIEPPVPGPPSGAPSGPADSKTADLKPRPPAP